MILYANDEKWDGLLPLAAKDDRKNALLVVHSNSVYAWLHKAYENEVYVLFCPCDYSQG